MGYAFFSFWSLLGYARFSKGVPFGMEGSFLSKDKQRIWKAGPLCILWTVWKARNDIVFRDEVLSIQELKSFFCTSLLFGDQVIFCGWSYDPCSFH